MHFGQLNVILFFCIFSHSNGEGNECSNSIFCELFVCGILPKNLDVCLSDDLPVCFKMYQDQDGFQPLEIINVFSQVQLKNQELYLSEMLRGF